jgi:hypothetical protein
MREVEKSRDNIIHNSNESNDRLLRDITPELCYNGIEEKRREEKR